MSHLALKIDGTYAALKPDTAIDITLTNPYFNDTAETQSHPFTLPVEGNRGLLGNIDCIESDFDVHSLEKKRMDVEVEGVQMVSGKVGNIEDQTVNGEVGVQMVSAVYSLDEYLDGVRCRDVPVDDDIWIGETIGDIKVEYGGDDFYWHARIQSDEDKDMHDDKTGHDDGRRQTIDISAQFPAVGFSRPDISVADRYNHMIAYGDAAEDKEPSIERTFINLTNAYPAAKYFNSRVAYLHHLQTPKGENDDAVDMLVVSSDPLKMYNPYLVLDANRPGSGICFYVLYFLDKLFGMFRNDGIVYDNTELMRVKDLRRLAFFTTHCKFDTRTRNINNYPMPHLSGVDYINKWLQSRNINTECSFNIHDTKENVDSIAINGQTYRVGDYYPFMNGLRYQKIKLIQFEVFNANPLVTANIMDMYANSQNFPDADAKTVLESLWGSFGIRFHLDQQTRTVKPVFIRDVLRDASKPIDFQCNVESAHRMTESTTGFRMQYSGQSDEQQRKDNITTGQTSYDTVYDYEDYRNLDINHSFAQIAQQVYDTNMKCYVDLNTGNLYRIKIDGSAEVRTDYHPSLFEVGQLHGVEIGDCSKENDDRIEEVTSSFEPIIMNDVTLKANAKSVYGGTLGDVMFGTNKYQTLTPFVSEDMWHEYIHRVLEYPLGNGTIVGSLTFDIRTTEAFDPSDTGDSPLQSLDWGLAVTFMRGGGYDATLDIYDANWENDYGIIDNSMFGCSKYRLRPTSNYMANYDTIDAYGNRFDYNGLQPGTDDDDENGSYNGTYTKREAADMIRMIWPDSNADLLSPWREVTAADAVEKGWLEAEGADYCTVLSLTIALTDADEQIYEYLVTPISDMGEIMTPDELSAYCEKLSELALHTHQSIMDVDSWTDRDVIIGLGGGGKRRVIQRFEVDAPTYHSPYSDFYSQLLHQFHDIYYGNATQVNVPHPSGLWIDYGSKTAERISMKIRSAIPAPADMIDNTGREWKKGELLCRDRRLAKRGLFDTFMAEYADFVLHRKKIQLRVHCQPTELANIRWTRRYRFGDYVGWINSIQAHVSVAQGIEYCDVELFIY